MRKEFPVNIESEEEWVDLPQGTHIHPKEVEKMFDDEEMGEGGREYAASIRPEGNIVDEDYGTSTGVKLSGIRTYDDARKSIFTHSHPKFLLKQELDEGVISIPPLSHDDLKNYDKEIRAFSQTTDDSSSGQIHSFNIDDEGTKKDIDKRKKMGGYLLNELKELYDKHHNEPKYKQSIRSIKGFPMSANMYTASEFNLARRGAGDASVIKVRKSDDPKKVYITGIRSTYKDEPRYDLLDTLPRKKKKSNPLVVRIKPGFKFNGLIKFNSNGLSNMLVGTKKKKGKK